MSSTSIPRHGTASGLASRRTVLVAAGLLGLAACGARPGAPSASLGGPFALVDTKGQPVTDVDLLGRPTAIFFGFTYCPEICPTTLGALTEALGQLGSQADMLNVIFVSLDPERDTPEQLGLYMTNFDRRIRGLTGSQEAVANAAKAYRIYYRKVPTSGGGYTMDHTSTMFLFDRQGQFVEPVSYGEPTSVIVDRLKALLDRA